MGKRDLNTSRRVLFGDVKKGTVCRVCGRDVDDGRRAYCSDWCREVVDFVASLYNWQDLREFIKKRDDHTCQSCGESVEMRMRAYHYPYNRAKELAKPLKPSPEMAPEKPYEDKDRWWTARTHLRERYDSPAMMELHVDHIEPISEGGHPFDPANLQTLCKECHHAKTAQDFEVDESRRPDLETTLLEFES